MKKTVPKYRVVWDFPKWASGSLSPYETEIPVISQYQGHFESIKQVRVFDSLKEAKDFMKSRSSAAIKRIKIVDDSKKLA